MGEIPDPQEVGDQNLPRDLSDPEGGFPTEIAGQERPESSEPVQQTLEFWGTEGPDTTEAQKPRRTTRISTSDLGNLLYLYRQYLDHQNPPDITDLSLPSERPPTPQELEKAMLGTQLHMALYLSIILVREGFRRGERDFRRAKDFAIPTIEQLTSYFPAMPDSVRDSFEEAIDDLGENKPTKKMASALLRLMSAWRNSHVFVTRPGRTRATIGGLEVTPEEIEALWFGRQGHIVQAVDRYIKERLYLLSLRSYKGLPQFKRITSNFRFTPEQGEILDYIYTRDLLPCASPIVLFEAPIQIKFVTGKDRAVYIWAQPDIIYRDVTSQELQLHAIDFKTGKEGLAQINERMSFEILIYRLATYLLFTQYNPHTISQWDGKRPFMVVYDPTNMDIEAFDQSTMFAYRVKTENPMPYGDRRIGSSLGHTNTQVDLTYLLNVLNFFLDNKEVLGPIIRQRSNSHYPSFVFPRVSKNDTNAPFQPFLDGIASNS